MVEDNTFTYHMKQPAGQTNAATQSLITKERTQKLDLLIHLLLNLTQSLVVCGPEGIGKTTLLNMLQQRKAESLTYCLVQGNADLSFESIAQQLVKILSGQSSKAAGQNKPVVLIIDNAGELVPGLITAIIQYAAANPVLRVILALTHDELQVKRGSDRAVDDCHIIEIPTLSEKQCGDFLRYLSAKPAASLSFKAISENMIAHIYKETHGVPGRIIGELSGFSEAKQGGKLKWIVAFVLAVVVAGAVAFAVQWLAVPKNADIKAIAPGSVEQKADNSASLPPQPAAQIMLALPPAQPDVDQVQPDVDQARSTAAPVDAAYPNFVGNEAEDAAAPSIEINADKDDSRPVAPAAKPEAESKVVVKALPIAAPALMTPLASSPSFGGKQEKPQQRGAGQPAGSPMPEKPAVKVQSAPAAALEAERKSVNQQPDGVQPNMAERLWARQEKLKQAELSKTVNSTEPLAPGSEEAIQLPQNPVEAAVPQQPGTEELAPTAGNHTLRLMVLSKQSSVDAVLKKYPSMRPGFRVINTVVNGQEKFILEYGSFPDNAAANKARQSLPFEFRNALVRKISSAKR